MLPLLLTPFGAVTAATVAIPATGVVPLDLIGLTFDGYQLQRPDLDIIFQVTDGLDTLPATRGADAIIPFRQGRLAQTHLADTRHIVATGWIGGSGTTPRASYRAYVDKLKSHLDPSADPRMLVVRLEDGSIRWCRAVTRNIIPGPGVGMESAAVSIEWEALDPFWYSSLGALTLDSGHVLDAGESLDMGAEIVITGSGDASIETGGTAPIERVRVKIVGPSSGPVGLETVGASPVGFTVARTLGVGEVLSVDNDGRTATVGGVSVRNLMTLSAGNRHGEYIRLPTGIATVRATGDAAQTRIGFDAAWL